NEERAGARRRIDHGEERRVGADALRDVDAEAVGDLVPGRRGGDTVFNAESGPEEVVDSPDHEGDDSLGRIESPGVDLHPRVVALEELLIEVDHGVAAPGRRPELIKDRLDVALPQVGDKLL